MATQKCRWQNEIVTEEDDINDDDAVSTPTPLDRSPWLDQFVQEQKEAKIKAEGEEAKAEQKVEQPQPPQKYNYYIPNQQYSLPYQPFLPNQGRPFGYRPSFQYQHPRPYGGQYYVGQPAAAPYWRNRRQAENRLDLISLKSDILSKLSNVTCTLIEMGILTAEDKRVNVEGLVDEIKAVSVQKDLIALAIESIYTHFFAFPLDGATS